MNATEFTKELEALINKHCAENESNTPDFILAVYMLNCLTAFNVATKRREDWYGRGKSISLDIFPDPKTPNP